MHVLHDTRFAILLGALVVAGCNSSNSVEVNLKPAFVGTIAQASYDGNSDEIGRAHV